MTPTGGRKRRGACATVIGRPGGSSGRGRKRRAGRGHGLAAVSGAGMAAARGCPPAGSGDRALAELLLEFSRAQYRAKDGGGAAAKVREAGPGLGGRGPGTGDRGPGAGGGAADADRWLCAGGADRAAVPGALRSRLPVQRDRQHARRGLRPLPAAYRPPGARRWSRPRPVRPPVPAPQD